MYDGDIKALGAYCRYVSEVCHGPIPNNYPAVGNDAFKTATGVHAAAIVKALKKSEDRWLADYVYSGVPANIIGLEQIIEIGPVSGKANIEYWLEKRGIPITDDRVGTILHCAKHHDRILTEQEIYHVLGLQPESKG